MTWSRIARRIRVPLGFAFAALYIWRARPTWISLAAGGLIALCRCARICIGGDTGPLHLAAAVGVPVVALFGPTDPARSRPYSPRAIVLRSERSQTTTSHLKGPEAGLLQITAAEVIAAARHLLAQTSEAPR